MTYCYRIALLALLLFCFAPVTNAQIEEDSTLTGDPVSFTPQWLKEGDTADTKAGAALPLPNLTYRVHNNGKFWNTVNNNGIIANLLSYRDPLNKNRAAAAFYFPYYSGVKYGDVAALWVGGIVGTDTLVSCAYDELGNSEFLPDLAPFGDFENISGDAGTDFGDLVAKNAEQIYRAEYTDTITRPTLVPYGVYDQRYHRPLHIKVTQTSYTWGYRFAEDFMIVDYVIENIGNDTIKDAWVGLYTVGYIQRPEGPMIPPRADDIEAYVDSWPYEIPELGNEKLRLVYMCDNDGEPTNNTFGLYKVQHVIGYAPLAMPPGSRRNNFNWWSTSAANWGPRQQGTAQYPFKVFPNGLGVPYGDKSKYYMMAKPEIDYNSLEAAVNKTAQGWLPPIPQSTSIARGHAMHTLSSYGPVTLRPHAQTRFTMVISMGEFIHTDPTAYRRLFTTTNPKPYENYLQGNLGDLIANIRIAKAIYDNPGYDTDGDGDSGRYVYTFDNETGEYNKVFYEGDGYPDFKGTGPPPAPQLRISTTNGKIVVRWNGRGTETAYDNFTRLVDFEGYRVWIARTMNEQEWSLLSSYDLDNFNRYHFNSRFNRYELTEPPFSIDSLRKIYGTDFDPLAHPGPGQAIVFNNESYYFQKVDNNASDLSNPYGIHKLYPDATKDTLDVDSEGRMRYYEYEFVIDSILQTVPYTISVTAFDHGNPAQGIDPLEDGQTQNAVEVFARATGDSVLKDGKLNVYVFPNPYRVDAEYAQHGYENRLTNLSSDRARSIWFANLPNVCKISIFSIDGDLIKIINHNELEGSGSASIERFDMITRNHNALTTGLYYWVVEASVGTQIGKFMVIK